jgi:hypothetical protein
VHVRTATSRPRQGYEKTARELVIWAGEQMQAHPGEGLDDMEELLRLPDDDEAGGGRVLSKVYPKTARASVLASLSTASTSRTTPQHHRQQALEHREDRAPEPNALTVPRATT